MKAMVVRLSNELPVRWTAGAISCSMCGLTFLPGRTIWYCSICYHGDYDLCASCYANPFKGCTHAMELRFIKLAALDPTVPDIPHFGTPNLGNSNTYVSEDTTNQAFFSYNNLVRPSCTDSADNDSAPDTNASEIDKMTRKFQDTQLKDSLMSSIVSEKPDVKWDDVAGLEQAKDELQEAIIFPQRFPRCTRASAKHVARSYYMAHQARARAI